MARIVVLTCYRYIEMNPVVVGMVSTPEQYRWSSYASHAWGKPDRLVTDHEIYSRLGDHAVMRQQAYREMLRHHLPESDIHQIRECLAFNYPLGNDRFRMEIEHALGRRVGEKKRGRPVTRVQAAQS